MAGPPSGDTNPLTNPSKVPMPSGVKDDKDTTHPGAVEQEYHTEATQKWRSDPGAGDRSTYKKPPSGGGPTGPG